MENFVKTPNSTTMDSWKSSEEDVHTQANKCILEAQELVFQKLPKIIEQIIDQKVWEEKNYKNFGEYALKHSSSGLSITNNQRLWLLKCAMDIHGKHALEWGDVLNEVDGSVRTYAKKNKIPIKELDKNLFALDSKTTNPEVEQTITYLPSRSKSDDGQLLKLRNYDKETYNKVVHGKVALKDVLLSPTPRKQLPPIESVKNKFKSLSEADREAFLAWVEEQKREMENTPEGNPF
ncbi:hypothetical protein [Legionella sp. WA2024007413]